MLFCLQWTVIAGIWAGVVVAAIVAWYAYQLPPLDDLGDLTRRPGITILSADGAPLASLGDLYGRPTPVEELPPPVWQALVAIEDRRFFSHFGIDLIGLVRAVWVNQAAGRVVQGGSTLTQQVAKNIFLTPERSFKRKIQEVLLALWLEHRFTKRQILSIYLNRVYYGAGAYGIDAAAQRYFAKPATKLNLTEAAVLAGLLRAPTRFSPARDPVRAAARGATVLAAMVDTGFITAEQAQAARRDEIETSGGGDGSGRYFADWVLDQLPGFINVAARDLVVTTTIEPRLQRAAEIETSFLLTTEGAKKRASQAAVLVLGRDGAVRALVGGRDYATSKFNRVTLALRQPGSAFKLFVYLTALERGFRPEGRIFDGPVNFAGWTPHNFERQYRGDVSLSEAFAHSLNTVAAKLTAEVGVRRVIATARRLGITSPLEPNLSLALGTSSVTLLELTAAYAAIGNDGVGVWPYAITAIRDRSGQMLWQRTGGGPGPLVDPDIAAAADQLLSEVVRSGTGTAARLPMPTAGKTGTTQDSRDAWFIGYGGGLTTGVWFGNDDNTPMDKVTGGDLPARLWQRVMTAAIATGLTAQKAPRPVRPAPEEVVAQPVVLPSPEQVAGQPPAVVLEPRLSKTSSETPRGR